MIIRLGCMRLEQLMILQIINLFLYLHTPICIYIHIPFVFHHLYISIKTLSPKGTEAVANRYRNLTDSSGAMAKEQKRKLQTWIKWKSTAQHEKGTCKLKKPGPSKSKKLMCWIPRRCKTLVFGPNKLPFLPCSHPRCPAIRPPVDLPLPEMLRQ